jgi:glucokinase
VILAGDIGGTKSNLGLFREDDLRSPLVETSVHSRDFTGLEQIISDFLVRSAPFGPVTRACFGIAGPIVDECSETPNLPWIIRLKTIRALLSIDAVMLINDLKATGHGLLLLRPDELVTLNTGNVRATGNAALIAAGTGLGEAILHWNGTRYEPVASEGGHADFAPRNDVEIDLLKYLLQRYPHVSYERVLSGPGLFNIYSFMRDAGYVAEDPSIAERFKQSDPSAVISEAALSGQSELCTSALNTFTSIYGAEAGNLALKAMAVSGIYLGGGIAPKIVSKLQDGEFIRAFTAKSRLAALLQGIPVHVILNPKTALYGAASAAALL